MPNHQHLEWLEKFRIRPGTHLIDGQISIKLKHHRMPGDILTMTPLVRDLKNTYGEQVNIRVDTPQGEEIWQNSPYLTSGGIFIPDITYAIDNKFAMENDARGLNLAEGFRQDFINKSGLHLNASDMWPDIWLTDREIESFAIKFGYLAQYTYWVICPGNKKSCRLKAWPKSRWIELVREKERYLFIHTGQSKHGHEPLFNNRFNYKNYIDKTETLRDLFLLIYFSRGTIGYNSLHMHIAAAFRKPCIVLGGARESVTVYKYPNHTVLSGMGYVECGLYNGCYLSMKNGKEEVKDLCKSPVLFKNGESISQCMDISVDQVISAFDKYEAAMEYYKEERNNTNYFSLLLSLQKIFGFKTKLYDDRLPEMDIKLGGPLIPKCKPVYAVDIPEHTEEPSTVRYSGIEDKERKVVPGGNGIATFRMLCNTHSFGGGERTAIRIMNLMAREGYKIELVPLSDSTSEEFKNAILANELLKDTIVMEPLDGEHKYFNEPCDIAFFQVNDTLLRRHEECMKSSKILAPNQLSEPRVNFHFDMAKRKIVGVNYDVTGIELYNDADCIIFQSTKLRDELGEIAATNDRHWIYELSKAGKIKVLHPPTDIQPFLDKYYDRDYSMIHLIRHSSQGDRKYDDNINEHIRKIYEARKDIDITLMPAPSFLHDMRVKMYPYNALRPLYFLTLGNVFWYWIPEEKYTEIGANVVLEAMASGLPILCNDNGGLKDIMQNWTWINKTDPLKPYDNEFGWFCTTEDEMYEAIKNMTIEEIKEKGENARKRVQEIVRPDLWVKYIIGE